VELSIFEDVSSTKRIIWFPAYSAQQEYRYNEMVRAGNPGYEKETTSSKCYDQRWPRSYTRVGVGTGLLFDGHHVHNFWVTLSGVGLGVHQLS